MLTDYTYIKFTFRRNKWTHSRKILWISNLLLKKEICKLNFTKKSAVFFYEDGNLSINLRDKRNDLFYNLTYI